MPSFDLDAIRAAQAHNRAILDHFETGMAEMILQQNRRGWALQLDPTVEGMKWLGVGSLAVPKTTPSIADRLIQNSKYFPALAKLERPAILKSKCRIMASCPEDQELIGQIWNNENLQFSVFHESQCYGGACIVIYVQTLDKKMVLVYRGYKQESGEAGGFDWPLQNSARENGVMARIGDEDRNALLFRIMQSFLRVGAYKIPKYNLAVVRSSLESISSLASKKMKLDSLDWAILWADFCLNLPTQALGKNVRDDDDDRMKKAIQSALTGVGISLAALDRFEDAAAIFSEIDRAFGGHRYTTARMYFAAGNHDMALKGLVEYASQLPEQKKSSLGLDEKCVDVLSLLATVFMAKLYKLNRPEVNHKKEYIEGIGCLALFSLAGAQLGHILHPETQMSKMLKQSFRSQAHAKDLALKVLRSGSLEEYTKLFRECVDPQMLPRFGLNLGSDISNRWQANYKEYFTKFAREQIKTRFTPSCLQCDKPEAKLCCPCRQASYCSKECQVANWKVHKHGCPHHQSEKKNTQKAQKE